MTHPRPAKDAVRRAKRRVEDALEEHGILLQHDAVLPSATRVIAEGPIRGSWWGHAHGALIYEALESLHDDVAVAKLVKGKETLVHRRLFPALIAIGQSREGWQMTGLSEKALEVLARLEAHQPLRADALPDLGASSSVREVFRELERRLLAHSTSLHTEGGHHVRVLGSWRAFQKEKGVGMADLCDPASGKGQFEAAVAGWGPSNSAVFPWLPSLRRR